MEKETKLKERDDMVEDEEEGDEDEQEEEVT